jgi:hypothetical protein
MSKLQAIQIDENTVIYVEATEDIAAPEEPTEASGRVGKGVTGRAIDAQMAQSFQAIQSTIRTYTKYTLNAFKDAALADVEKVTLEFGMNVSGSGGVPYIAAGTVGCNIKVTVECAFPKRVAQQPATQQPVQQSATQQPVSQARQRPPAMPYSSLNVSQNASQNGSNGASSESER